MAAHGSPSALQDESDQSVSGYLGLGVSLVRRSLMSRLPLKSCLTISRLANFAWHSWKFVPTRGRGGVAAVINDFFAFDTNWKSARRKCKQWEKTTACKSLGSCRKLKLTSLKPELTPQSGENITKTSHKAAKLYFYFPYQFGLVQFEARSQENMCTSHSVYCLWASVSASSIWGREGKLESVDFLCNTLWHISSAKTPLSC